MKTHICCRDCRFEAIVFDMIAERTIETHERDTGHTVDSEVFDGSKKLVTDGGWGEPEKRERILEQMREEASSSGMLRCKAKRIAQNTEFDTGTVGKYLSRFATEEPSGGVDVSVFHDRGRATVYEIAVVEDEKRLVTDGGVDTDERIADALERIGDELERQNAVLTEQARAQHLTAVSANDYTEPDERAESAPNTRSLLTKIRDTESERERVDDKPLMPDGGIREDLPERCRHCGYDATEDDHEFRSGGGWSHDHSVSDGVWKERFLCPSCGHVVATDEKRPMADGGEGGPECDEEHCDNVPSVAIEPLDGDERREVCLDHAISAVDRIGQGVRR